MFYVYTLAISMRMSMTSCMRMSVPMGVVVTVLSHNGMWYQVKEGISQKSS